MADPISIVASVITVAGAALAISDTILTLISELRNAPNEITFVHNDVTDTRLILSNIKDNAAVTQSIDRQYSASGSDPGWSLENIAKMEYLTKRTERVLLDIDFTIRACTKSKSLSGVTLHQRTWFLNRTKLRFLRQELREMKTSLAVHFSASSSTHAQRSIILLKKVLVENAQAVERQSDRNDQLDASMQGLAQQLADLSSMPEAQRQLMTLLQNLNIAVVATEERSRRTTTTESEERIVTTTTSTDTNEESAGVRSSSFVRTASTTVTEGSVSRFKLEFSRFQKRACVSECECTCHIRRKYRSPSFVEKLLGGLFIGFSSLPLLSRSCSDSRCTQKSPFSATFTYYLPSWLLQKMISLVFVTTLQGDPAACIKVRPLSHDFSIYRAVETNKLQTVRTLLDKHLAHPSATFKGGWTPLHYAISYGHTAICKSLLAIGADPLIEDGTNQLRSALEWAWMKILGRSYEDKVQQEMEQLFSDKDCLEEMCFTTLHRIILSLDGSSLEQELLNHPESINHIDSSGRTALSWAAQRGMTDVVQTLLQSGADPNICTPSGHSPLQYASEARNPHCLQPLLGYGADVTQYDLQGQTALHHAAIHQKDLTYYRPLVDANSDVNHITRYGSTPLTAVIQEGWTEPVQYLIENGADIHLKGQEERSPIFYAVEYNNHYALSLLHDKGADFTASSEKYPTIAHVAAHHADTESLQIMASFNLTLTNIDCVNWEGLTIPQIIDRRLQLSLEDGNVLVDAFRMFLESIDADESTVLQSVSVTHEVEADDVFYDALQ